MSIFENLPIENFNINTVILNQQTLNIDNKHFIDNDIIIIESGTGTGKTKEVARKCKIIIDNDNDKYELILDNKEYNNILSIVNLISLALEQIRTFETESKIKLHDYRKVDYKSLNNKHLVICINSIQKILNLPNSIFQNVVLYIDEANNLIETMTHNSTLDKNLNLIYTCLMKIIKNSKKIILTDATITQNVFNLISPRKKNIKTVFIKNTYKKYEGIEAIQYNNKNEFYNKLKENIKNKDYFLFACDVCSVLTTYYNDLINEFPDLKNDFILITSESNVKIYNASTQFKNKFVFYSPSITTGVSFIDIDKKQTQFLYITGQSVNPNGLFQMASRTRNIKELIYFCEDIKPIKMKYSSLKDVETKFKNMIETNDKLLSVSQYINIEEEPEIIENTFFKMYCYNEYINNIFFTGFLKHFENILINNGFKLKNKGEVKDLDIKIKVEHTKLSKEVKEKQIKRFGKLYCDNYKNENIKQDENIKQEEETIQFNEELYLKRCEILGLKQIKETKEIIEYKDVLKYSLLLQDDIALNNYLNFIKLIKTNEYIESKLNDLNLNCKKIKNLSNPYTKINLLKLLENKYKISRFCFEEDKIDLSNKISDNEHELIINIFRLKKQNLITKKEINLLYIKMIKNISGDIDIIISKRLGKQKLKTYFINKDIFKDLIDLQLIKDPYLLNCNIEIIKTIYPDVKIKLKPEFQEINILD